MKHIIIAGASRSGKTTLALKLAKHGFVHYKMDSIKRGIDDNFHDMLLQVKIINIDVDEFMKHMEITKKDCPLGHDEMNAVFEHLGFVKYVNL